ncbi:hypothetical protein L9F63_022339 [Diploptera punctata]|uniref:Uncharacterized protein n=1 Tax=Diploptera punctata TaxID=6984 RepID=A0AAD7ZNK2_DIPPU|nr:hypothetical protein L9F63_022339 [Diploptera punctata]
MAENQDSGPLPPGWDRKYDHRTGRYYFINYFSKTTTWEDPRVRYRQLQQPPIQHTAANPVQESIPLQHGSSDSRGYHVYPSNSSQFPPQPAFQTPGPYDLSGRAQELTNVRPGIMASRALAPKQGSHVNPYASSAHTETTLTTDTEQSVAKISAVFPTVTETHIRALLMKYHNREAVVMSALQVEKHPISTPGPYATPPLQGRHFHAPALQMTPPLGIYDSSRTGSPIPRPGSGASGSYIGSPRIGDVYRRPHSSPKMKLRYLKSVFPKAEETLLLDILSNSDNNVQKATEKLIVMGFEKRDTPPPKLTLKKKEDEKQKATPESQTVIPTPPPRMKSLEEKQKMKSRLQENYPDIPERVVSIALDSVDFDEDRANQILNIMIQEEEKSKSSESTSTKESQPEEIQSIKLVVQPEITQGVSPVHKPSTSKVTEKDRSQNRRSKGKKDVPKISRGTSTTEDKEYKSPYLMKVCGPNRDLYKGPNDELLLVDYVTWNGPNVDLLTSYKRSTLAKGPDKSLLQEHTYKAKGPNSELKKGPMRGLAKGSIYSRLTGSTANESRGK